MIITTYDQYIEQALNIINNNEGLIRISSFGLGAFPDTLTETFINEVKKHPSKIIVGTTYLECTEGCKHCLAKNVRKSDRFFSYSEKWDVKFTTNLHLKYISRGNKAIVGGINLTNSSFNDVAIVVEDLTKIHELNEHFNQIYTTTEESGYYQPADHVFTFGKYAGTKVKDVVNSDPTYISWVKKNLTEDKLNRLGL